MIKMLHVFADLLGCAAPVGRATRTQARSAREGIASGERSSEISRAAPAVRRFLQLKRRTDKNFECRVFQCESSQQPRLVPTGHSEMGESAIEIFAFILTKHVHGRVRTTSFSMLLRTTSTLPHWTLCTTISPIASRWRRRTCATLMTQSKH